jgi:endonuclease YncB( thermonuclease family)
MIAVRTTTILFGLLLTLVTGVAAERREWVTFTNCHYVTTKDGDGDSFRVRSGTNEFKVRLYFVDAPETTLRYAERSREQAEHFGITLEETVRAGVKAREVTRDLLREPFTVRTRWASAAGGGREPRYYSFVDIGTNRLAVLLVSQGWARTKGVTATVPGQNSKAFAARLRGLEAEAQKKRLGIWASASPKQTESATDVPK